MIGSQTWSGLRTLALRVTLLAIVAAFVIGVLAILAYNTRAATITVTVNTTDNDDDSSCDPLASGDCTLHEAIDDANNGAADIIKFDTSVFSPGTIDLSTGELDLPVIEVEVIIDAALWKADSLRFHPLVNTSTLVISREAVERFVTATGHAFKVLDIPER